MGNYSFPTEKNRTEIPLGTRKTSFLPVSTTTSLGPTFVDDDAVLPCGDSPPQLTDKIQEATGQKTRTNAECQQRKNRGARVVGSEKKDTGAFPCSDSQRSPWKRQVLVDLCRLRDNMRHELGTMPRPTVKPEASQYLWKCVSSHKKWPELRSDAVSSAHPAMGASVSSSPDVEFSCPNLSVDART